MKESDIRDYLAANFSPFTNFIVNLKQFESELSTEKNAILAGRAQPDRIYLADLVKLSVIGKLQEALPIVENLELLDKEYVLLKTGKAGVQPSVDLMAYNTENYCIVLIELKISDSAEREAVTELAAYNQGLQNRYRGLSSLEVLWMPISSHWRTTTKSAISFEVYWKNSLILPLEMKYAGSGTPKAVTNIELKCFNPVDDLKEHDCLNLFSYECFDAFDFCLMEDIDNKHAFVNYVASLCSSQNIHGFIIFHKPVNMMYPYGFTICIYNAYKGYLHRRISEEYININGIESYSKALKGGGIINTEFTDINFKTDKIEEWKMKPSDMDGTSLKADAFWEKEFLSVGHFAENMERINTHYLVSRIKERLISNGKKELAFGTPNFETMFQELDEHRVTSIMYLGIHLDLISNRLLIEHHRNHHELDFFVSIQSLAYLKDIFGVYNQR